MRARTNEGSVLIDLDQGYITQLDKVFTFWSSLQKKLTNSHQLQPLPTVRRSSLSNRFSDRVISLLKREIYRAEAFLPLSDAAGNDLQSFSATNYPFVIEERGPDQSIAD